MGSKSGRERRYGGSLRAVGLCERYIRAGIYTALSHQLIALLYSVTEYNTSCESTMVFDRTFPVFLYTGCQSLDPIHQCRNLQLSWVRGEMQKQSLSPCTIAIAAVQYLWNNRFFLFV